MSNYFILGFRNLWLKRLYEPLSVINHLHFTQAIIKILVNLAMFTFTISFYNTNKTFLFKRLELLLKAKTHVICQYHLTIIYLYRNYSLYFSIIP